jgi:hypothetical protein
MASGVKGVSGNKKPALHSHHQIQGRNIIIYWTVIDIKIIKEPFFKFIAF